MKQFFIGLLLTIPCLSFANELPLEAFIKHGDYLDMSLSPNGEKVAARIRLDGRVGVLFLDRTNGSITGGLRAENLDEIHTVNWVNDERVIFSYAQKFSYLDRPIATGELLSVDYTGRNQEMLAGYRADDSKIGTLIKHKDNDPATFRLISTLEEDDRYALIIEYPWSQEGRYWYDNRTQYPILSKINVYSGKKRKLETLPFKDPIIITNKAAKTLFASWIDENDKKQAAYKAIDQKDWTLLGAIGTEEEQSTVVAINDAGDTAYLYRPSGENGFRTLYSLDLKSNTRSPIFTDVNADLYDWAFDPITGNIAYAISYPEKVQYHYPKDTTTLTTLHKKLARSFKGQKVNIVSSGKKGNAHLVHVSSDINPGEYYFFDAENNKADFLWANLSWIDPGQMRPMINTKFTASDKLEIPLQITQPVQPEGSPLVVLIHGGPHGTADLPQFDSEVQLLANRGYTVLQVNFRGSDNFGETFQEAGYKQWGNRIIQDIHEAIDWTVNKYNLDASKVCAFGASFGGYAASMLAARYPDSLACAVGYVGIYDLNRMYSSGDIPLRWGGESYLEKVLGRDTQQLAEFSPINHADKIKANILLIHGKDDVRAPIEHAQAMKQALQDKGKHVEWLVFGNAGHGVWDMRDRHRLYSTVLEFLQDNLKK